MKKLLFILTLILSITVVKGAPHHGKIYSFTQPDGTKVELKIFGDEYYSRAETPDGYTVIRDEKTRWICYAELTEDGNNLISTGIKYISSSNKSAVLLEKGIKISNQSLHQKVQQKKEQLNGAEIKSKSASLSPVSNDISGEIIGLTIVVDFSDQPATLGLEAYDSLLNQTGYKAYGNNGSVRDYYHDISGGKLDYRNLVMGVFRAKKTFAEYDGMKHGAGAQEIISDALQWLKAQDFDFSTLTKNAKNEIYALNLICFGDPSLWGGGMWWHQGQYTGNQISGYTIKNYNTSPASPGLDISTICHENGHMLCSWPDTYKYDESFDGIDKFDLMCWNAPKNPTPPNPKFLNDVGWITTREVYGLKDELESVANDSLVYKYTNPNNPKEYYLFEHRNKTGRSAELPDEGLTIWHVDEDGDNQTAHHEVILENAYTGTNMGYACYKPNAIDAFNTLTLPSSDWYYDGNSQLSVSEIMIDGDTMTFTLKGTDMLDKSDWKLISGDNYNPTSAFDGNPRSWWLTSYSAVDFEYPHELVIDLKLAYDLRKFTYLPRLTHSDGRIAQYELYAANDTSNWGEPVAAGTWDGIAERKDVFFEKNARYLKFKGLSEVNGKPIASAAEITLFGTVDTAEVPLMATAPFPVDKAEKLELDVLLKWNPGTASETHHLYVGNSTELTESDYVGALTDAEYHLINLPEASTIYWRIDEANKNGVTQGEVWSFETLGFGIFTNNEDFGSVPVAGSYQYKNDMYTVSGTGTEIWNTKDKYHFVYKAISGDYEFITQVTSIENGDVGIMFRETPEEYARNFVLSVQPDNQVVCQYRNLNFNYTIKNGNASGGTSPNKYIRIVRKDDTFSCYYATESKTGPWIKIGSDIEIKGFESTYYAGIYVCSNGSSALNTATFEALSLEPLVAASTPELTGDGIQIYPNPNNGLFTLHVNENANFRVFDANGKLLLSGKMNKAESRLIDLSHYRKGMYFITISTEKGVQTEKVLTF